MGVRCPRHALVALGRRRLACVLLLLAAASAGNSRGGNTLQNSSNSTHPVTEPPTDNCRVYDGQCGQCLAQRECGYCRSDGRCSSGGPIGPGHGHCHDWVTDPNECCNGQTCSSCTSENSCGFCSDGGGTCMPGDAHGSFDGHCRGPRWAYSQGDCSRVNCLRHHGCQGCIFSDDACGFCVHQGICLPGSSNASAEGFCSGHDWIWTRACRCIETCDPDPGNFNNSPGQWAFITVGFSLFCVALIAWCVCRGRKQRGQYAQVDADLARNKIAVQEQVVARLPTPSSSYGALDDEARKMLEEWAENDPEALRVHYATDEGLHEDGDDQPGLPPQRGRRPMRPPAAPH